MTAAQYRSCFFANTTPRLMDDAPSLLTPLFERASEQERLHVLVPVVFKELPRP